VEVQDVLLMQLGVARHMLSWSQSTKLKDGEIDNYVRIALNDTHYAFHATVTENMFHIPILVKFKFLHLRETDEWQKLLKLKIRNPVFI
jgi:hypothetical protein